MPDLFDDRLDEGAPLPFEEESTARAFGTVRLVDVQPSHGAQDLRWHPELMAGSRCPQCRQHDLKLWLLSSALVVKTKEVVMFYQYDVTSPLVLAVVGEDALYFSMPPAPVAWQGGRPIRLDLDEACVTRCAARFHHDEAQRYPVQCGYLAGAMPDGTMLCGHHALEWWATRPR
jgi:hypothetical protein